MPKVTITGKVSQHTIKVREDHIVFLRILSPMTNTTDCYNFSPLKVVSGKICGFEDKNTVKGKTLQKAI